MIGGRYLSRFRAQRVPPSPQGRPPGGTPPPPREGGSPRPRVKGPTHPRRGRVQCYISRRVFTALAFYWDSTDELLQSCVDCWTRKLEYFSRFCVDLNAVFSILLIGKDCSMSFYDRGVIYILVLLPKSSDKCLLMIYHGICQFWVLIVIWTFPEEYYQFMPCWSSIISLLHWWMMVNKIL